DKFARIVLTIKLLPDFIPKVTMCYQKKKKRQTKATDLALWRRNQHRRPQADGRRSAVKQKPPAWLGTERQFCTRDDLLGGKVEALGPTNHLLHDGGYGGNLPQSPHQVEYEHRLPDACTVGKKQSREEARGGEWWRTWIA